jgi:hypothetical protein
MKMLGNSEKADAKDFAKATQLLSSITWKYKGDSGAWAKQLKEVKAAAEKDKDVLKSIEQDTE